MKKYLVYGTYAVAAVLAVYLAWAIVQVWQSRGSGPVSAEQAEATAMASDQAPLYRLIKAEMPDDYKTLLAGLVAAANRAGGDVAAEGVRITNDIRRKYAPRIAYAGAAELNAVVTDQRAMLVMLRQAKPAACADVMTGGTVADLAALSKPQVATVVEAKVALFKAMIAGLKTNAPQAALDADYAAYSAALIKAGVSDAEVDAIADAAKLRQMPADRVCAIGIATMDAAAALAPQTRLRFLATMLSGAAAI